jgi:hypothetical protein
MDIMLEEEEQKRLERYSVITDHSSAEEFYDTQGREGKREIETDDRSAAVRQHLLSMIRCQVSDFVGSSTKIYVPTTQDFENFNTEEEKGR